MVVGINQMVPENQIFQKLPPRDSFIGKTYCGDMIQLSLTLEYLGDDRFKSLMDSIEKEEDVVSKTVKSEALKKFILKEKEYQFERKRLADLGIIKK